jgi:hypothetical protein
MKTKNLFTSLFFTFALAIVALPSMASDSNNSTPVAATSARSEEIMNRLEAIKAMDIKSMSPSEKKSIRMEVKKLKAEKKQADVGGGVYISAGALILIIILLIILL